MSLMTKYAFRNCEITPCTTNPTSQAVVRGQCAYCGKPQEVSVWPDDLQKFRDGNYAQNCFPYLTAEQREFLISGICGTCWDNMFPEEEE
jgi:hypothetical protein